MKENTNYSILLKIFIRNGGFITRKDVDEANVSSWFLSYFVKKNGLSKIAPGFYGDENYIFDKLYILQRRYPKYVFTGITALYLYGLTDRIPEIIEVVAPQGYNPSRIKDKSIRVHQISDSNKYLSNITEIETNFGNTVKVYSAERVICDLIKNRDKYDSELFIKAIKLYLRKINNQVELFECAKNNKIEKQVFEMVEVINSED